MLNGDALAAADVASDVIKPPSTKLRGSAGSAGDGSLAPPTPTPPMDSRYCTVLADSDARAEAVGVVGVVLGVELWRFARNSAKLPGCGGCADGVLLVGGVMARPEGVASAVGVAGEEMEGVTSVISLLTPSWATECSVTR